MGLECQVCCESAEFYTIGECDHKTTCLKCSLKMKLFNDEYRCMTCN